MNELNPRDTQTLAGLRRLVVAAMRLDPKVDRAVRAALLDLQADGLQELDASELREELANIYENGHVGNNRMSCVSVFDELAAMHCIDSERDYAHEDQVGLLECLREAGVAGTDVLS